MIQLPQVLLDTDTLSVYMRREPVVVAHIEDYLDVYGQFNLSIMTRYEILRGLKAKRATAKITRFNTLCAANNVFPLTDEIVEQAAEVYADLYRRGELISDGDMLIAGTALVHNLVVITNNEKHFSRISGLHIDNWLK